MIGKARATALVLNTASLIKNYTGYAFAVYVVLKLLNLIKLSSP